MAKEDKRRTAKELYMTGNYTQERISALLGINAVTITKWKATDDWEKERDKKNRLSESSETRIRQIIDFNLSILQARVEEQEKSAEAGNITKSEMKLIDGKETDALAKLFAQIKKKDLSFSEKVEILTRFFDYLQTKNKGVAESVMPYSDAYIQELINSR